MVDLVFDSLLHFDFVFLKLLPLGLEFSRLSDELNFLGGELFVIRFRSWLFQISRILAAFSGVGGNLVPFGVVKLCLSGVGAGDGKEASMAVRIVVGQEPDDIKQSMKECVYSNS